MDLLIRLVENDTLSAHHIILAGNARVTRGPSRLRFADQSLHVDATSRTARGNRTRTRKTSEDRDEPTLFVSEEVRKSLCLPDNTFLHATPRKDEWILGPCLALYANPTPAEQRKFGEQTNLFRDLTLLGRRVGVDVTVITPGFLKDRMGWRYLPTEKVWTQCRLPMPDIVLRRSGTFRRPWAVVNEELQTFSRRGKLHTLPRNVSNKWTFYREMKAVESVRGHLPESYLARKPEEVWRRFRSLNDVYVKPLAGAQGVSVYRLRWRNPTGSAQWEERPRQSNGFKDSGQTLTRNVRDQTFSDQNEFIRFWKTTGLMTCLVQETVELPRTRDNRPFDFRWLVQMTDEPRIVARVARVGRVHSVTTNIHTGAEAVQAETALEQSTWSNPQRLIRELDGVALQVAQALRRKYGPFAELGVDLAIRNDGRIVVFEVNPTPGRRMLRALSGSVREMSLECLLEYAIRAAGFSSRGSD